MNYQDNMVMDETTLRVDLAAAFRLAVHFNWHESVGNHFSVAVSPDGSKFLMNPKWRHFSTIKASDLLLLDANDQGTMQGPDAPDESAWCIHGAMHRALPNARVLLHCHPRYATALATLRDPTMRPIDQNTARFFGKIAVDLGYGGIADNAQEGQRIARALGNKSVLMMGNHGITITAPTIAEAFEDLYFYERAAETLMLAYASEQPLNVMSDELASRTAESWGHYTDAAFAHFEQLKEMLDDSDPSYRE